MSRSPPLPRDGRPLLVLLDFDGTLVPIALRPDAIQVDPDLRATLQRIEDQGHTLRIVTGRPAAEIEGRLPGIEVVGLHGLQWVGEPLPPRHPAIDQAKAEATALASRFQGILVEDKRVALALHYRQVPAPLHAEARARLHALARDAVYKNPALSLIEGHELIEIRPRDASKGRAISRLVAAFPDHQPLYIGDDQTDEEAFAALPADGIAIRVGPPEIESLATHRLDDVPAVHALLQELGARPATA